MLTALIIAAVAVVALAAAAVCACQRPQRPMTEAEMLAVVSATAEDRERVASTGELHAVPDQLAAVRARRRRRP